MKTPGAIGDMVIGLRSTSQAILRAMGTPAAADELQATAAAPVVTLAHVEAPPPAPSPLAVVEAQIHRVERSVASLSTHLAETLADLTTLIGRCVWRAEDSVEKAAASLSTSIEQLNNGTGDFMATVIDELAGLKVMGDATNNNLQQMQAALSPDALGAPKVLTLDAFVTAVSSRVILIGETSGVWTSLDVDWGDGSAVETYVIDWANVEVDSPIRTQACSIFEPSSGHLLSYTYNQTGAYVIRVVVNNADGSSGEKKVQVRIQS